MGLPPPQNKVCSDTKRKISVMGGLQEHIYVFGDFSCYSDIGEFCKKNYYHQNLQLDRMGLAPLAGESHRSAWHVRVQIILVCRLIRNTDNIYTFINDSETKKNTYDRVTVGQVVDVLWRP